MPAAALLSDQPVRFVLGNRLMTLAGGTEVHLVTIGVELMRLGHEVVVSSPSAPTPTTLGGGA